ncbi:MAG: phospholipase C [Polyangiales bacterium]
MRRFLACSVLALGVGCSSTSDNSSPLSTQDTGSPDEDAAAVDTGRPPVATPPDPTVVCPLPAPVDSFAADRKACKFAAGAKAKDTVATGETETANIPIRHIVVLMKENRSFDHLLFKLHDLQPDVDAVPDTYANPDTKDAPTKPSHAATTCIASDPNHQWNAMHNQVNGGAMDGFIKSAASTTGTDGLFSLSYYDQTDLPFYYWLASTWALNDRHFASVRSGTYPDRNFLYLGTNDGVKQTALDYPDPATTSIFDRLSDAGFSWGVYTDSGPLSGAFNWDRTHAGVSSMADFKTALAKGTLPNVAFVDGTEGSEDEHPTADVQTGEAWTRDIYQAAIKSPQWPRMALIWTYDEGGGFFDHVAPPNDACIARPGNPKDTPYFELGVRVPLAMISPYSKPHFVSHVVQEHTSITRFVETVFDLPALTSRDANADALLDMLDFSSCTPPMLHPPEAPASGTGGCKGK